MSINVLDAGTNRADNDANTVVEGKSYTTMEHKWDEAFGYLYGTDNATNPALGADSFLNKYLARVNGDFIINPSRSQLENSDIDMMVGASADSVMMVEGEMDECSEEEMSDAIKFAHESIKIQIAAVGKKPIREYETSLENEELAKKIHNEAYDKCYAIAKKGTSKTERSLAFSSVKDEVKALFTEEEVEEYGSLIGKYFSKTQKEAVRELTLSEGLRLDGRKTTEIRPIWCEVDYLPSTHGSSIFTRGETQALATVTLGTSREANKIDMPSFEGEETF